MSESYVTHNECTRTTESLSEQIRELQKEVHQNHVELIKQMTELQTHFNDELDSKIQNKEHKLRIVTTILGGVAGVTATFIFTLIRAYLGF